MGLMADQAVWVARPKEVQCTAKDPDPWMLKTRCLLRNGHPGEHYAEWYATGESGFHFWSTKKKVEIDPEEMCVCAHIYERHGARNGPCMDCLRCYRFYAMVDVEIRTGKKEL